MGYVHIRITGPDISGFVSNICGQGVILRDLQVDDGLRVRAIVRSQDLRSIIQLAGRTNHKVTVLSVGGLIVMISGLLRRPVLVLSLALVVFLTFWIPSRVFFVGIEGNQNVPYSRILLEAESCGIRFGAKRSVVRSEAVKNRLLESMPELQWVGVNTKGCIATISVKEDASQKNSSIAVPYSNIVADRDGIVLYSSVTAGAPACKVGEAVKEGQILISGWQDMGLIIKTTRAAGEIYAQTDRVVELVTPLSYVEKGKIKSDSINYSLIVGKKRINLSKGSGISYAGCDKIYASYYLTLPGGFTLPLALETTCSVSYEIAGILEDADHARALLSEQADKYLLAQTVSGTIQGRQLLFEEDKNLGRTTARYTCVEMIGRERIGEMDIQYGEDRGENR